jgi:hypothetical protein
MKSTSHIDALNARKRQLDRIKQVQAEQESAFCKTHRNGKVTQYKTGEWSRFCSQWHQGHNCEVIVEKGQA